MQLWKVLAITVALIALPARADIKSYNAAMQQGDYKAAAAAAASTWPTLDKSRKDYAVIAREFGFAACLAGDFAAARNYGEAAVAASSALGEDPVLRSGSEVVLRLAEFRLDPDDATRDALFDALERRAALPGVDMVTYVAVTGLTTHDFEEGLWPRAVASASLGERLTRAGGPEYATEALRFGLNARVAEYLNRKHIAAFDAMEAHRRTVIEAIAAYPEDQGDEDIVRLFYETEAWLATLRTHLIALGKFRGEHRRKEAALAEESDPTVIKAMARIAPQKPGVCPVVRANEPNLTYPSSALFRGMVGTVMLRMELNAQGGVENPQVIASVPIQHFGDAVLAVANELKYVASDDAPPGCTLAQKDVVLSVQFRIKS